MKEQRHDATCNRETRRLRKSGSCGGRLYRCGLVAVALLAAMGTGAVAQDGPAATPLTIETAASLAVASSSSVRSLEISLADQLEDLGIMGYLDGIRLSLGGSLGGSPFDENPDTDLTYGSNARLSANLEIIPQLSLSGTLSANLLHDGPVAAQDILTADLGLTLSPLADPTGRDQEIIAVDQATIDLSAAIDSASFTAISRLLDAIAAERATELDSQQAAVAEQDLANSQALYERDRISEDQLEASERELRSARQDLLRSELSSDRATASLAQAVGLPVDGVPVVRADAIGFEEVTEAAISFVETADVSEMAEAASGPQLSLLDVRRAELHQQSALVFSPELTVSASAGLPDRTYSLSAEISVSPSDFDFDARKDAEADLADAERAYEYAVLESIFGAQSALMDLEFALEDLDDAAYALGQAQQDLDEATFFSERGEITELEFQQVELDLALAEYNLVAAQISVAKNWYAIEFRQY